MKKSLLWGLFSIIWTGFLIEDCVKNDFSIGGFWLDLFFLVLDIVAVLLALREERIEAARKQFIQNVFFNITAHDPETARKIAEQQAKFGYGSGR